MSDTMVRHQLTRVRHELRRRTLTVSAVERVTPGMIRVHFESGELDDFVSASFDDHIKMFLTPPGSAEDRGGRPPMRDFTPRRYDAREGTIAIDFAVHDAGPAVEWALAARAGQTLQIGGPRGSTVIPDDFDWYVLIGDESALPAIGRRIEELRPGVPVTSFVLIADASEAQAIETGAAWTPHWVVRIPGEDEATTLLRALASYRLPGGEGFVWIAGETSAARAARRFVIDDLGQPREWVKASGYWQRGLADAHGRIED